MAQDSFQRDRCMGIFPMVSLKPPPTHGVIGLTEYPPAIRWLPSPMICAFDIYAAPRLAQEDCNTLETPIYDGIKVGYPSVDAVRTSHAVTDNKR